MNTITKPKIVVSRCLGFENCRYNGQVISAPFVKKLESLVEYVTVCPEVEIGLGVPRDPIRITVSRGKRRLVQPAGGRDVTAEMQDFAGSFLNSLEGVDGFILKSRSPSCGVRDVKIYSGSGETMPAGKGAGFFGGAVLERFDGWAAEDEGRLSNFKIREHFLTNIYVMSRFRSVSPSAAMKDLVRFQAENKLLLMAYNQTAMRTLGRIVANHDHLPAEEVFKRYEENLRAALRKPPRYTSNINVLMHALGYFSNELSSSEKAFFLDSLESYHAGKIPLSSLLYVVRSWIVRFGTQYLVSQTYFLPYPEELVEITDSGKGRKL